MTGSPKRPFESLPSWKSSTSLRSRSLYAVRRYALMASVVAGLGIAGYGLGNAPSLNIFSTAAHAQVSKDINKANQPTGFADIVERVKPSVISVRVKISAKADTSSNDDDLPFQPGSPMDRFFRRFGGPDGVPGQRGQGQRGRAPVSGQGSGFFISADGYAVTNNHVVEDADSVEISTDDGKTYPAKVIGTDPRALTSP